MMHVERLQRGWSEVIEVVGKMPTIFADQTNELLPEQKSSEAELNVRRPFAKAKR